MNIKNQTWIDKVLELFDYTYIVIGLYSSLAIYIIVEKKVSDYVLFGDIINNIFKIDYIDSIFNTIPVYKIIIIFIALSILGVFISISFELLALFVNKFVSILFNKLTKVSQARKNIISNFIYKIDKSSNQKIMSELYDYVYYKNIINSEYKDINSNYKIKFLLNHLRIYYYDLYKIINKKMKLLEITKNFLLWILILVYSFHVNSFIIFDGLFLNFFLYISSFFLIFGFIYSFFRDQIVGDLVSIIENIENKPV